MKKTIIFLLTLLLTALLSTAVWAKSNIEYSGPIDSFTGLPTNGKDIVAATEGATPVSKGVAYDFAKAQYMLYLDDTATTFIYSNIVNGMVTTDPVSFEGDSLTQAELYLDGELQQGAKLNNITASGEYTLSVKSGANSEGLLVSFTIISKTTSLLGDYTMPTSFVVLKVKFNDEEVSWKSGSVDMQNEGVYEIEYRCNPNKKVYNLKVAVDRTPPTLALTALKDGKASGPVSLADLEEGAKIHIALEGKKIPFSKELTSSGNYIITVEDAAQNSTKYQFTILLYFNGNSYLLFAMLIFGAVALYVYTAITKKRMRIC